MFMWEDMCMRLWRELIHEGELVRFGGAVSPGVGPRGGWRVAAYDVTLVGAALRRTRLVWQPMSRSHSAEIFPLCVRY